ncbi:MAG: hypothetical protein C0498_04590 [Anaerolinea sp.]|nr:hypothetical protein [Anaerolinea sp.]
MSVEFEPVKLGRRRRSIDPAMVGLVVVAAAIAIAIVKPWGVAGPATTAHASPTIEPSGREPEPSPASAAAVPPSWLDVTQVVSPRREWGIRTIVTGASPKASSGSSPRYTERWIAVGANSTDDTTATVDARDNIVVALGVTFPPAEAPLDVRIWLDRGRRGLEWIDARPINDVPARGAYLFLRGGLAGAALQPWEPGRYRVDVLAGGDIRRIDVEILDGFGVLPDPKASAVVIPPIATLEGPDLDGLPVGLFAFVDGAAVPLTSTAGAELDQIEAWLNLDRRAADGPPRSFVARAHLPLTTWLGVVLPPVSTIRSANLRRLAPFEESANTGDATMTTSGDRLSFVAFAQPGGATWPPGVYALRVKWVDGDGLHDQTWHLELRPGYVRAEPVLLSATRAWAGYAGSSGILLGTTEPTDGGPAPSGIRLLDIAPGTGAVYPGLGRSKLVGCGETLIRGAPSVIGFVGPETASRGPVTSTILFPLADDGPLPVLTAARAVPGLAIVAPVLTTEFGGPALYGFRAGSSADASGYTVCIGMAAPGR